MDAYEQTSMMTNGVLVDGLSIRFADGPATEEAIASIHRCIGWARFASPVTVLVRWDEPGTTIRTARLLLADGEQFCASGPALLPALHKLCEHARSMQAASAADRLRWRQATAARNDRRSSGVYTAV